MFIRLIGYILFILFYTFCQMKFNFKAGLNGKPFRWKIHKKTLQAIFSDMLIVTGVSYMFDTSYISLFILGMILNILMFADLLYMRYYKNPLTISVVVHNVKVLREAKESIFTVLKLKDLLEFIDIPFLILFVLLLRKYGICTNTMLNLYIGGFILVLGSIWLLVVYHYSNREPYKWNRKRIARDLGILFFHIADIINEFFGKLKRLHHLPDEQIEKVLESFSNLQKNIFTGCCKNKRVILIQMESMQDYLTGMVVNGREVTPEINRLAKDNIRFTNMYHQTSVANTSDAELLSNNSLYPSADKPSCYEYQNNRFLALGERLSRCGYTVKGFHGNQASTWNRHLVYRQYGYQSFTDNSDMVNDEVYHLGLGDSSFFRQVLDMEQENLKNEKSFIFLITLSQHHPFKQFENYDFDVGEYEGTMFGNYLKAANYADKAIGELVQNLKEAGLYDDTLIFMYGDHSGIPELYWKDGALKEKLSETDNEWLHMQKVTAFMHLPESVSKKLCDKVPSKVDKIAGQVDILPTLVNLMGLDQDYLLGNDLLDNSQEGAVVLRDGTVIGNDFVCYADDNYFYSISNEYNKLDEIKKKKVYEMRNMLRISDLILDYDLINLFLKKNKNKIG